MFYNSWNLIISNQPLHKIYRGKFAPQTFSGKFEEYRAKYPSHPQKFACYFTYVSIDGFYGWSSAIVHLSMKRPDVTYRQVFNSLRLSKG